MWHTTCSYTLFFFFFILTCSHRDFSFLLKLFTYSLTCSKEFEKKKNKTVLHSLHSMSCTSCSYTVTSVFGVYFACSHSLLFLFFFSLTCTNEVEKNKKKNCSSLFVQYKLFLYCNISVWSYILPAVTVFFPFCFFKV